VSPECFRDSPAGWVESFSRRDVRCDGDHHAVIGKREERDGAASESVFATFDPSSCFASGSRFAKPKSSNVAPDDVIMMLPGLTSR
jgi:hypothetical protein